MAELLEEYKRLRGHPGVTCGAFDPVFLQDKILYLNALDEKDHLPTLKLDMPVVSAETGEIIFLKKDAKALNNFLHVTLSELGWVVKTPFTTHGSIYRGNVYCKPPKDVEDRIIRLAKFSNYVPKNLNSMNLNLLMLIFYSRRFILNGSEAQMATVIL